VFLEVFHELVLCLQNSLTKTIKTINSHYWWIQIALFEKNRPASNWMFCYPTTICTIILYFQLGKV